MLKAIAQGAWISVVIHGIAEGYHAISRETFVAFVNQVKEREEKLWVATYGEADSFGALNIIRRRQCGCLGYSSSSRSFARME